MCECRTIFLEVSVQKRADACLEEDLADFLAERRTAALSVGEEQPLFEAAAYKRVDGLRGEVVFVLVLAPT